MSERKPAGLSFETWVDRRIREAIERGEFDDLPGAGKPLPGLSGPEDELWWVKGYLRRENLPTEALLPAPLLLRREVERLPETVRGLPTERAVRAAVADLNGRIVDWMRTPSGPALRIGRVDPERIVAGWRAERTERGPAATPPVAVVPAPPRPPWWRRLTRRAGRPATTPTNHNI